MRDLDGTAEATIAAPLEECLALLAAVDRYPGWYPEVVKEVAVLERGPDGQPQLVQTKLHVKRGPLRKDFDLVMAVGLEPHGTVTLKRARAGSSKQQFDVTWNTRRGEQTQIEVQLHAKLDVPRLMPLGDVGNSLAAGFVHAAGRQLASDGAR